MCRISGDINTTHPRVNEVGMRLAFVGGWHQVNEGIIVERAAFNAAKCCQPLRQGQTERSLQVSEVNISVYVAHYWGSAELDVIKQQS